MKIGLACVLFSFVALSIGSSLSESLTYDEVFYRQEGQRIWTTRSFSDPYNPPLAPLLTAVGKQGRFVTIALGVLLILAVYRTGGIVAATILAFEPTFLSHSHYVTGDVAITLFIFLVAIAKNPLFLGMSVGYALSSKMSSLVFLPIVFFFRRKRLGVGATLVAIVILWASYLFTWDVVIREREDIARVSVRLVAYAREKNVPQLERFVMFLREQPLPLGTYLATIKNNVFRFGKPAMIFFDGALYDRSGWYFMVVNVLRKLPLPFLILVMIGAWYRSKYALIGIGIIGATAVIGMVPLVRYVLPAVPFLAIAGGRGVRVIGEIGGIWGKIIIFVLILWLIVGTVLQYPHFLSYANELAGPREKRYEILADSNLDWGQALPDLARYVQKQKISKVKLSYFGRDDENEWRFEEICAFHDEVFDPKLKRTATVISVSNWYYCGYNKDEKFGKEHIWDVVADSLLVF